MLRLGSSKVAYSALRAIASPRILIPDAFSCARENPNFISYNFSTDADADAKKLLDLKLVNILKSEIESQKISLLEEKSTVTKIAPPAPADFPFTLNGDDGSCDEDDDDSCDEDEDDDDSRGEDEDEDKDDDCDEDSWATTFTREFDGEEIDVLVPKYWDVDWEVDDDKSVDVVVKIYKENNGTILEFQLYASTDQIRISFFKVEDEQSEALCFDEYFVERDSELQFALREFLEIRGINIPNIKYMLSKSKPPEPKPMHVLEKLEKFLE